MFLQIPDILTPAEVTRLRELARSARFAEGRLSNPHTKVKNNEQIDTGDPAYAESSKMMAGALQRSREFRDFTFAKVMAPPLLARYHPGMNYGLHSDAPFMPLGNRPLRSDVSCTLFLNEPETYEGGELSIDLGAASVSFKLPPGHAVVYPSTTLHQVKPVTSGERLVGLTFIESSIPDPVRRDLLWRLDEVAALEGFNISWENRTQLQYVRDNLKRMWSEPG